MSAVAALARDEDFDALRYFRANLPNRPYCSDDLKKGLVIRGRDMAAVYKHVQANPPCRIVWLTFDVDQPDAATAWSDRGAPAPTLVVGNPDIEGKPGNGHAHLLYGLQAPVTTTMAAHEKPLRYLAAVQEGLRRKLDADKGYAGLICKNPLVDRFWQVHQRAGLYTLAELADWVELPSPAELRKRAQNSDYAGLGRNCQLFEELRPVAYNLVRGYWRPGGEEPFGSALRSIAEQKNAGFGVPLPSSEVGAIARSIARWTWRHFSPAGFREAQAARGRRGGKANGTAKRDEFLFDALVLDFDGLSQRAIARELNLEQSTVCRWLKRYT